MSKTSELNRGEINVGFTDAFIDGSPKEDGRYLVKANDIVNSWQEILDFKDGDWYMLCGNLYPAIVDGWRKL